MALINCPECNRDVSNQAASCPGCAHPISKISNGPFGGAGPAITVRPDFWHDPNVGAVGALIGFFLILVIGCVFVAIFN